MYFQACKQQESAIRKRLHATRPRELHARRRAATREESTSSLFVRGVRLQPLEDARAHAAQEAGAGFAPYDGVQLGEGQNARLLVERYDARALLDVLQPDAPPRDVDVRDDVDGATTRAVSRWLNWERYRTIVEAARVGCGEEEHVSLCERAIDDTARRAAARAAAAASRGAGTATGSGGDAAAQSGFGPLGEGFAAAVAASAAAAAAEQQHAGGDNAPLFYESPVDVSSGGSEEELEEASGGGVGVLQRGIAGGGDALAAMLSFGTGGHVMGAAPTPRHALGVGAAIGVPEVDVEALDAHTPAIPPWLQFSPQPPPAWGATPTELEALADACGITCRDPLSVATCDRAATTPSGVASMRVIATREARALRRAASWEAAAVTARAVDHSSLGGFAPRDAAPEDMYEAAFASATQKRSHILWRLRALEAASMRFAHERAAVCAAVSQRMCARRGVSSLKVALATAAAAARYESRHGHACAPGELSDSEWELEAERRVGGDKEERPAANEVGTRQPPAPLPLQGTWGHVPPSGLTRGAQFITSFGGEEVQEGAGAGAVSPILPWNAEYSQRRERQEGGSSGGTRFLDLLRCFYTELLPQLSRRSRGLAARAKRARIGLGGASASGGGTGDDVLRLLLSGGVSAAGEGGAATGEHSGGEQSSDGGQPPRDSGFSFDASRLASAIRGGGALLAAASPPVASPPTAPAAALTLAIPSSAASQPPRRHSPTLNPPPHGGATAPPPLTAAEKLRARTRAALEAGRTKKAAILQGGAVAAPTPQASLPAHLPVAQFLVPPPPPPPLPPMPPGWLGSVAGGWGVGWGVCPPFPLPLPLPPPWPQQ